jgi:hypothetical protein
MGARLGDDIDDFCVKCKRVMNHAVVSLVGDDPAKVRCRTCHSDHDYRHEQAPPPKIDPRKLAAQAEKAAALALAGGAAAGTGEGAVGETTESEAAVEKPAKPAAKGRKKA